MDLVITMLSGESRALTVQPQTTVQSLKSLIQQAFDLALENQFELSHGDGQKISLSDDSKPVSFYGLQSGSQVWLLITQPTEIQVFLRNERGQTHTYSVTPAETVNDFKRKVQTREHVPADQQRLIHEGKQMEDGRRLVDYGVRMESTIYLTLRLRGG